MVNFEGQTVLITGAGRGLGLEYARCIGKLGATVLVHDVGADSSGQGLEPDVAERAVDLLREDGIDARMLAGDITSRKGCHELCHQALQQTGRLDGLIHNAGWVEHECIGEIDEHAFDRMMAVSAKAPLWLAQAAWPSMSAAGYGRIVVTTSCRALYPQYAQSGLGAYAAAKMAAIGVMNVLALEGSAKGIIVNAVSPVAKTRMWGVEGEPKELKPEAVAPGVAYLASSDCLEGGWILRAANGQFHATRLLEADRVNYPRDLNAVYASTAQEVARYWHSIAVPAREPRR